MLLRHLLTAFVNVCYAIGYAHSRKVIHRDLKPENVVIDSFGQVVVIDWGLAKIVDDTSVESLMDSVTAGSGDRTNEGQVLGTPLYMAPEQAAGRLDELDQRTDTYGLGAILFAIVTGYAPHEKTQKEAVDSGVGARGMISVIASGATPAAREVNPDADAALEAICRKAMARRRYARYQAATELAEEVQRWMAGEPVAAYQESAWQRTTRWVTQHQRLSQFLLASGVVALVALTTLGVSTRQNQLAEVHAKYARMEADVHEVEFSLRGVAAQLEKNVRFLASAPPVQRLVNPRAPEGESEERERLETIFAGMLRSNPDYLALSFESKSGELGAEDIVRVERNPSDPALVRVQPASRLQKVEMDKFMAAVATLAPGDVRLSLEPRTRHANAPSALKRLSVATPIYSEASGECYGMIAIESDIAKQIAEAIAGLSAVDSEIYVADGDGVPWVASDPVRGVRVILNEQTIPDLPEPVAKKVASGREAFELLREGAYIAKRFYVDPAGRGVLIFARLGGTERTQ